jgi:hypothetical protein
MTSNKQDELMYALASELDTLAAEGAERLCTLLRGLFTCMQDLNQRVAMLESQGVRPPGSEN